MAPSSDKKNQRYNNNDQKRNEIETQPHVFFSNGYPVVPMFYQQIKILYYILIC